MKSHFYSLLLFVLIVNFSCKENEELVTSPVITVENVEYGDANIRWTTFPTDTGYRLYLNDSLVSDTLTQPFYLFRDLNLETTYHGKVVAERRNGSKEGEFEFTTTVSRLPAEHIDLPKRALVVLDISGLTGIVDSMRYKFDYNNEGRISAIEINSDVWDYDAWFGGSPQFLRKRQRTFEFTYLQRKILVREIEDSKLIQDFVFDFNNDNYILPSRMKIYDTFGGIKVDRQLHYEHGFLKEFISPHTIEEKPVVSAGKVNGNNLNFDLQMEWLNYGQPDNRLLPMCEYGSTPSPINQFCGFSYFHANPLYADLGVNLVNMAIPWFRPSANLTTSLIDMKYSSTEVFDNLKVEYQYSFIDGKVVGIKTSKDHMILADLHTWTATIEY